MTAEPSQEAQPAQQKKKKGLPLDQKSMALIKRIWHDWMAQDWRRLAVAAFLMALVAATTGAYPLIIQQVFDAFETRDMFWIYAVPVIALVITTVKGLAFYGQSIMTQSVVAGALTRMRSAMFVHLLKADLAQLTRQAPGTLISRFTVDLEFVGVAMTRTITNAARDLLTIIALFCAMIYIDWVLTLIVICIYPIAIYPVIKIGDRLRKVAKSTQVHMGDITSFLSESLSSPRVVKTYQLETHEAARADTTFNRLYDLIMKRAMATGRLDPMLEILGGLAFGGVVLYAGTRIVNGDASIGQLTGFVSALLMMAQPIRALGKLNAAVQEGLSAAQRYYALLDEPPTILDAPDAKPLQIKAGAVRFDTVHFSYGGERAALDGVTIEANPGETVALVGPSGAGKSTVINLIPRLFDIQGGHITIDGQDVRDVTLKSLRNQIALVSQDVVLFDGTIKDNIAFARSDVSDKDIIAAAKAAAAHDFIMANPQGYDAPAGERGQRLSGGERQRVAIARAILRNAPILLLDEATSALDAESEKIVQDALVRLKEGRTTFVIAHRLATVQNADRIYVFDDGKVVESGDHETLTQKNGLYAKLARLQFRDMAEAEETQPAQTQAAQ